MPNISRMMENFCSTSAFGPPRPRSKARSPENACGEKHFGKPLTLAGISDLLVLCYWSGVQLLSIWFGHSALQVDSDLMKRGYTEFSCCGILGCGDYHVTSTVDSS